MELYTERLKIIPLKPRQFKRLLDGTREMEKELNLNQSGECLDENTKQAMEWLYQEGLKNRGNYVWYTNWQIILISENRSIGSACFKGKPNENGEVEIGYGIYEPFRCCGYMTEAAKKIIQWAIKQPDVVSVTAETEKNNIASDKVLQNCGMQCYKETDESFFWHMLK